MSLHRILLVLLCFLPAAVWAQAYPDRPIRIIVPFAPGGGVDIVVRTVTQHLAGAMKQVFVVDNRAGGGGTIGTEIGARANPDGYTLLVGSSTTFSVNPVLMRVQYDPGRDFVPITMLGNQPRIAIVSPSVAAKSIRELVALAKQKPGALHYSSSGNGGPAHLGGELFKQATGTNLVHVPYKGQSPAILAVMTGEAQFSLPSFASVLSHVKSGKVRGLAVSTKERMPLVPDIPTFAEQGFPDLDLNSWMGIFAPAGLPPKITTFLHARIAEAMRTTALRERFQAMGVEPGGATPGEFAKFVQSDRRILAALVKSLKLRVE